MNTPISPSYTYDAEAVRAQFPIFKHHPKLVYLDSAATAQKPQGVIDCLATFLESEYGTVRRGLYALSVGSTHRFDHARHDVATFINAPNPDTIVFTRGATEAINIVAHGFAKTILKPDDVVVITAMEHHANLVPWQQACLSSGAQLRVIPITEAGQLDLTTLETLLCGPVKLLALSHVSNVLGTINPVETLIKAAHDRDIPVLLDGCQAVPHLAIDVQALDCDFYAFSAHKLYGPTGVGVLYGKPEWLDRLPPMQFGGDMIDTVTFERSTFAAPAAKFEAGTPAISEVIALSAAIQFVSTLGLPAIAAHEHTLLQKTTEMMQAIPGLRLIGTAPHKAAVQAFVIEGVHPLDLATVLDHEGVAIRTGHHCAQPLMARYGVTAMARASFAAYNTIDDVYHFQKAMHKAIQLLC
ncbi:MAG: SufS family cysteine desulfurase [Vampirovibrionales bacterium]|nr:SufS family cysteine desulfurase [Vampirovibrionales bacterium]